MKDYLVVGFGLAGAVFSGFCQNHNKSFLVINSKITNSSIIAAGLFNPVILKRFTITYKAQEQLDFAYQFYTNLEELTNTKFYFGKQFYRKFFSVEEQNDWFVAADKPLLSPFLSTQIIANSNPNIVAPFHFGEVKNCGFLDVAGFLTAYKNILQKEQQYKEATFDYSLLKINSSYIEYNGIKYKHIVFAEGYNMRFNPFFCNLPLDGSKGELLLIKAPNLNLDEIVKSAIFVLPIGNDLYKVGATYNWVDKTDIPTQQAKEEILLELNKLITCKFEVIDHFAGVRPTVKDRKPLVGTHPYYNNIHIVNGLGTRGVLIAPYVAKQLFEKIENNKSLDLEINIERLKGFPSNFFHI